MTTKQLKKKLNLSDSDMEEIKAAVEKAEKNTSGEIALAIAAESDSYAQWELVASGATALILFLCIFPLSQQIYSYLSDHFWGIQPWYLSLFFAAVCSMSMVVLYFLYNIPAIDYLVIPSSVMNRAVTNRAFRHFAQSGVYCTESHSGILIFVSYFEKQVRVIADAHVSKKISGDLWKLIADEISENIQKGDVKSAFISALEKCGQILAENFSSENEKKNELYDGLVILED